MTINNKSEKITEASASVGLLLATAVRAIAVQLSSITQLSIRYARKCAPKLQLIKLQHSFCYQCFQIFRA